VNREHQQILDAIARGDPKSASASMRKHLTNSRERLRHAGMGKAEAQAAVTAAGRTRRQG